MSVCMNVVHSATLRAKDIKFAINFSVYTAKLVMVTDAVNSIE